MSRTATGPNGEKLVLENGKWVPLSASEGFVGPIDEMTGPLPSLGRTPEEQTSAIRQGLRTAGGTLAANLLSIPHASGELLAGVAAIPQTLAEAGVSALRREPLNLRDRFAAARRQQESSFPASALLAIPDPSTEDVLAATSSLGRSFSAANQNAQRARALWRNPNAAVGPMQDPRIGSTFAEALAGEQQRSANQPIATGAGRVGGDIATLLALQPGARATKALGMDPRAPAASLARGLARTAEAGIDGAVIAAMGEGDPLKTAAYSAGIQAGGSAALAAKSAMLRNPVKTFGALWLGHQMYKAVAPGPQQAFESSDAAIKELIAAYAAGTAASMLGAGRGVGDGVARKLTDVMSTASRGTIASVITQLQEADGKGNTVPSRVLELMGENPDHFGADARQRLEKAASDGNLSEEIDALMADEAFREKLGELPQQRSFAQWLMRTGGGF